jgi:hypothetical protein
VLTAWLHKHSNNEVRTSGLHFSCDSLCDANWLSSCRRVFAGASVAHLPMDLWPCVVPVTRTSTRASICTDARPNNRTTGKSCHILDQVTQVRTSGRAGASSQKGAAGARTWHTCTL